MTLTRSVAGLLFADDFNRADGAPGANYINDGGTWAIVGNKLRFTGGGGGVGYLRASAAGNTVADTLMQFISTRSNANQNAIHGVRYTATNNYVLLDLAASGDGIDPSRSRCYNINPGATRLGGGATVWGLGPNRTTVVVTGNRKRLYVNDRLEIDVTNAALAAAGYNAIIAGTATAGTVDFDSLVITTGSILSVSGLPANYMIRCGGRTSAPAVAAVTLTLDLGDTPLPTGIEILDAAGVVVDTIGGVYGGDTWAYVAAVISTANLARSATGLLFSDDFNRANGAPGANWTVDSGTWAIAANKLVCSANGEIRLTGLATRRDAHVQLLVQKSNLNTYAYPVLRKVAAALTQYQGDIGASSDGTDPNKTRLFKRVAGAYTRLAGGGAPGPVVNVDNRHNFSAIGSAQDLWIDGGLRTAATDNDAALNAAVGHFMMGVNLVAGGTVTIDDVIVCSGRTLTVSALPAGYSIACGGNTAVAVAGTATLDILGTQLPATLFVLNNAGVVVSKFATGVYGDDVFVFTPASSYSATGSGGVALGGTAPLRVGFVRSGSGGVAVGGSAPPRLGWVRVASGGVIVAGSAPPAHGRARVGSGGVSLGGSAPASHHLAATRRVLTRRSYTGTGEVGDRSIDSPAQGIIISRTGATGIVVPRAAGEEGVPKKPHPPHPHPVVVQSWRSVGSGGVHLGGSAPYSFFQGSGGPIISPTSYAGHGSGGVALGGSAPASSSNARQYPRVGSGGIVIAGAAPFVVTTRKSYSRVGSGGLLIRGAAPSGYVVVPPPGGGGGGWTGIVDPPAAFDPSRNPAHFTSEVTCASLADLQVKLNTVPPGTRIRVPLGVDWSGVLNLRNRGFGPTEWIEIAPDMTHAAFEAARPYGREMTLGIAGSLGLPTLRTPGANQSVIMSDPGAQGVRLTGMQFRLGGDANAMVRLGKPDMANAGQACKRIIADRCTAVGGTTYFTNRAFYCCGEEVGVVGCWIADIYGNQDSQGVLIMGWQGPYAVLYNHVEGWTENIMMGGAESPAGGVPSDVWIQFNHITKNIAYRFASPFGNTEKNLIEAKSVRRARIRYNLIEYAWAAGQEVAANWKSVDQGKSQPQQGTRDLEFAWNWIRNSAGATKLADNPEGGATPMQRVSLHDNLWEGINTVPNYNNGGLMLGLYGGLSQILYEHNTIVKAFSGPLNGGVSAISLDQSAIGPIWIRSNLIRCDGYGMKRSGQSEGVNSWNAYVPNPGDRDWRANGLVGRPSVAGYPAGSIAYATDAAVGYADLAGGNYQVTGPAATAGHDGGPLGISDYAAFLANFANIPG